MRPCLAMLLVLSCMVHAVPAGAASAMPDSGTRIRLSARLPQADGAASHQPASVFGSTQYIDAKIIGPFVSVADDTVTMRDSKVNGVLVTIPAVHVTRFEISRGQSANGRRGARLGFVTGALLGAGVGYASMNTSDGPGPGGGAAFGAVALGAIGAAIGGVIGVVNSSEKWRDLPLEDLRDPGQR